jgi:hypothetical protein
MSDEKLKGDEIVRTDVSKKHEAPWQVGYVLETGERACPPIKGANHEKLLVLKGEAWVCKHCRCAVHRRSAYVDPWGNVYCKRHFPWEGVSRQLHEEKLKARKVAASSECPLFSGENK